MWNWLRRLFGGTGTVEKPSPKIRITPGQVHIVNGTLTVTGLNNCFVVAIDVTNSMEPGIDDGMFVFLDPDVRARDLIVGDIIWYEHPDFKAIHRIIDIGIDADGWYAICQGDNNANRDPVRVRASQIRGTYRGQIV